MMDITRFYKGVADHGGEADGYLDYDWVLQRIENEDHPYYGPPIPRSMRSSFDRVLRDIYAPALREHLNRPPLLVEVMRRDR